MHTHDPPLDARQAASNTSRPVIKRLAACADALQLAQAAWQRDVEKSRAHASMAGSAQSMRKDSASLRELREAVAKEREMLEAASAQLAVRS